MCQNIEEYIPVLVMCPCQFPSAILIPGGDCHMKGAGMLVGNFELNPLKRPTWAWANLVLTLKETILLQCSLGTDAIEYMN